MYEDDPDAAASKLLTQTLYTKNPCRYPVLGELDSFNLLSRQDMLAYHRSRYCSNNVFVVVTGDVEAEEVAGHLEKLTSELVPVELNGALVEHEPRQWGRRTMRGEFALPYSKLSLAWRIPDSRHPDMPALIMLSSILTSGRSARLYGTMHDEWGLVHDIAASVRPKAGEEGVFQVSMDVDRDRRDEARNRACDEIRRLAGEDLSEDIARCIKRVRAGRISAMSSASGLAEELGIQWFHYRNIHFNEEWTQIFETVTTGDIKRVVDTYLTESRVTEVSLDPIGTNAAESGPEKSRGDGSMADYILPNGLHVVLRPDKRLPMVPGFLTFKAGSPFETADTAGVTPILGECMLKGTQTRSAEQVAQGLENLGGSLDWTSGNNSLGFSFNVLSEDVEAGLDLLSDVVLRPSLPTEAFEIERQTAVSDAEERLEDPFSLAFDNASRQTYGNRSYGLPNYGTPDSLRRLDINTLKDHYGRIICGQNAVLSLVGDFDTAHLQQLVEQYLGGMAPGERPFLAPKPPQQAGEVSAMLDKEQAVLVLSVPGVDVCSPERAHAMLFHAWCSDMAGPVFTSIREEAGLAYYASSYLFMGLDTGCIMFYLGTSMEQLDEARATLETLLHSIEENGISEPELERTRAALLASQLLARQSNKAMSQCIGLDVLYGLPPDQYQRLEELVSCVTPEEMNNFIKKVLSPEQPRVWSVVKNGETA